MSTGYPAAAGIRRQCERRAQWYIIHILCKAWQVRIGVDGYPLYSGDHNRLWFPQKMMEAEIMTIYEIFKANPENWDVVAKAFERERSQSSQREQKRQGLHPSLKDVRREATR